MAREAHRKADGTTANGLEVLANDDGVADELESAEEEEEARGTCREEFACHFFTAEEFEDGFLKENGQEGGDKDPAASPPRGEIKGLANAQVVFGTCVKAK